MRRPVLLPLCVVLLIAGYSLDVGAYCPRIADKKTIRWSSIPATYRVSSNLKDAAILVAIDKAFGTWSGQTCQALKFKKGATFTVCTTPTCKAFDTPDKAIFIHWVNVTSTLFTNTTPKGKPYFANYSFTYDKAGGFGGAALALNAKDYNWDAKGGSAKAPGIFDVWNELVPLIGWAIGLTDSLTTGAVMQGTSAFGDTKRRTLKADDINGLRYLYGLCSCKAPPAPDAKCPAKSPGKPACFKPAVGDGGATPSDAGGSTKVDGGSSTSDGPVGIEIGTTKPDLGGGGILDGTGGKQCTAQSQCASGEICTIAGICVKAGGDSEEGCGCVLGGEREDGTLLLILLVGLLGLAGRRRAHGKVKGFKPSRRGGEA